MRPLSYRTVGQYKLSVKKWKTRGFKKVTRFVLVLKAFGLAFTGLIVSFCFAWWIMAQMNFSYRYWHDFGGMAEAIDRLAQTNVLKSGFEKTSKEQRDDLFRQIMDSVHDGGRGLAEITYDVPGEPEQNLLIEAEIIHLQDVANLIDLGLYISLTALVLWVGQWLFYAIKRARIPSFRLQVLVMLIFVVLSTAVVFAIGPMKVFYQLHVWLFPPDHQWYFYFKESLMATMMYAPTLFGWIAIEWLAIALLLFPALQYAPVFLIARLSRYDQVQRA